MQTIKKIFNWYIVSTVIYASETWVNDMADWKRLEAFEIWVLRKLKSDEGS